MNLSWQKQGWKPDPTFITKKNGDVEEHILIM
jgi:hypothetical protein